MGTGHGNRDGVAGKEWDGDGDGDRREEGDEHDMKTATVS